MPRTYVNRILLTTLYGDLCTATREHPVAAVDLPPKRGNSNSMARGDLKRQLCFFPSDAYMGESDGFLLFRMPVGTTHEGWNLAVPRNRVDRMWKGPVRKLYNGYVVRYPERHYAYPMVKYGESSTIETDDIQSELLSAWYYELLPADSAAHWVRVGKNHAIRVKLHGMNSRDRRATIIKRVVMRDYWNDQYFNSGERRSNVFLSDVHASTICRITNIMEAKIRDLATDGSPKANARAVNLGDEWYECDKCGFYGPVIPKCGFSEREGYRHPIFTVTCPECGSDCTPSWLHDMNVSMDEYARRFVGKEYQPFSKEAPRYTVLRTGKN